MCCLHMSRRTNGAMFTTIANKKELVTDLMAKAKQVEYLIQSLPQPEEEEEQVRGTTMSFSVLTLSRQSDCDSLKKK